MPQRIIKKYPIIIKALFVIALFVMFFISSITFKQINHMANSSVMVTKSYKVTLELEQLISYIKDAETGDRGYIIVKDSVYLEPFINARKKVNNSLTILKKLLDDNPVQKKNLDQLYLLINKRFVNFSKITSLFQSGKSKNIEFYRVFKEGKICMDDIRLQVDKMIQIEKKLLGQREFLNKNYVANTPTYIYIIMIFTLLLIVLAYSRANSDFNHIKKQNSQLNVYQELANQAEIISKSGSWSLDLDTGKYFYSENFYRLLGAEPNSFEAKVENITNFIHPDDIDHVNNERKEMKNNKVLNNLQFRIITADEGIVKHIKAYGKKVIDSSGNEKMIGTITDFSSEVKYNEELERYNQQLIENNKELKILDESHRQSEILGNYGSWLLNLETNVFSYSDNKFRLLGCEPQSFNPTIEKLLEFVHPDDRLIVVEGNKSIVEKGFLPTLLYRIIRKDGQLVYFRTDAKIFEDLLGVKNVIGTTQDVTNEINQKNALSSQNFELERSNKELSAFNHVASHDLQEPLRKIQTFISRLEDKEADNFSESGNQYLERIKLAATRMRLLIDDLLQFSRTNKAEKVFEKTDLNELLENAKQEVAEIIKEKNAEINSNKLPTINVIPFQIQQLFINLIGNSLKYSKDDVAPIIDIHYSKIKASNEIILEDSSDNVYHKIVFKDNGIGFNQEYAERIFVLFSRLHEKHKYTGTGIGLSICKKIVENHNGFIFAQGETNVGAEFTIYIPNI